MNFSPVCPALFSIGDTEPVDTTRSHPPVEGVQTAPALLPDHSRHFRTDHLLLKLGEHSVSAALVTAAAQAAKFVLNLGSAVVLARLLSPSEFGLVAMVLAVTSLLGLFKEAGLSTATVQRESITQQQVSNLFWINVGLGSLLSLVSVGLAAPVAWFYRDERLIGIMLALSITFVLTGSTVQHTALLTRQMRFQAIAAIELTSVLLGFVLGCVMALAGYGYWALVAMQLSTPITMLAMTWWMSGWKPSGPSRNSGVAPMLKFGAHLTASNFMARIARNSDAVLIGRFFGAESLGLYSRASALLTRPIEQLSAPLDTVLIPALSRLQSDPERYRRTFLRASDTLALITFPLTGLFLALSEPLVLVLLGPKWRAAIPLFAAFTLTAISLPLGYAASWLFTSQGRGGDLLRAYSLLSVATVLAFASGLPWGPLGVVLGYAIYSLVVRLPTLYHLAGRTGPVSSLDLWKGFLYHMPCWACTYAGAALTRELMRGSTPITQLLVCTPAGLAAGAAAALAMRRPRQSTLFAVRKVWGTVREKTSKAG